MEAAYKGLLTIFLGVGGCLLYFYLSNQILDKVLFPAKGAMAGRNINRANMIRPWLFVFPAMAALGIESTITTELSVLEQPLPSVKE